MEERSLFIVGAAGEGIQTIGDVLSRCFLSHGYATFTTSEFESRIRGGNSSVRIRVSEAPRNAPRETADVLLAVNPTALEHYRLALCEGGLLITSDGSDDPDDRAIRIPFADLAVEHGGGVIYANAVAAGALCAAVGLPFGVLTQVLTQTFSKRGAETIRANLAAARAGFNVASPQLNERGVHEIPARPNRYAFASAHETIPIAAAAAGCRFMAAYPMSPSTGIITAFAQDPELGVFAEQAEDEIAAINMALGASAAGARAMTATSGGGFALMAEGISLAGMIETPIVIVLAQRPGPATGLPTRTAQEDLLFALHAGHGEFPRALLAPSDPQDAIRATIRAFDLADRYQMPVIILTDQFLADSRFSLTELALPEAPPGPCFADPETIEKYERFRWTEDGVSPRLYFGQSEHLVVLDSDEHTEAGHITEDLADVRPAMVEKRLEKGRRLRREMDQPRSNAAEDADLVLIGWGSTKGAIDEAVDRLRAGGRNAGSLHFAEVWPLPDLDFREDAVYWTVEGNATGQFAHLLESEAGMRIEGKIGRYDGLPIDAETILEALS
jgi:2-oxoglutarate ferredoxin oxidoreductase subunit alpha